MATFEGSGIDANSVLVDPTGLTNVTSTDAQGALADLDAAMGVVPNADKQFQMLVSPGNTIVERFFAPYDLTIVEISTYCDSGASTDGTYTLAVEDEDTANNLLGAATFDMETPNLPAATLTAIPLTGTAVDLDLTKGTRVKVTLTSNNADLVASGVYVQIIYRSQ